jgi:hypothetical protein
MTSGHEGVRTGAAVRPVRTQFFSRSMTTRYLIPLFLLFFHQETKDICFLPSLLSLLAAPAPLGLRPSSL